MFLSARNRIHADGRKTQTVVSVVLPTAVFSQDLCSFFWKCCIHWLKNRYLCLVSLKFFNKNLKQEILFIVVANLI